MNHSTTTPNRVEAGYIENCKTWECVACAIWEASGEAPPMFVPCFGCDFHHFISGGIRVGHLWGVGLCLWHHRRVPLDGWSEQAMRRHFGPSLMDGSRTFREAFGTDAELLRDQDLILESYGVAPPERPENKRGRVAA